MQINNTGTATAREAGILYADVVTDEFDDEHYICSFVFNYKSLDGAVAMSFSIDPATTRPGDWTRLAGDIRRGVESTINVCRINGEVSVTHKDGRVIFVVEKHGSGGDGTMDVTLPAPVCLEAIETCAAMFADHVASGGD
nr:hypothetical protein [Pandoravirus massiliensis]